MRRILLGLAITLMAGLVPGTANGDDPAIRQHITNTLKMEQQRGNLNGFHLNLRVDQGTVWYEGYVSSQAQKTMVLRTAQRAKNLGVVQIVDDIEIRTAAATAQNGNSYMQQAAYTQDVAAPAAPTFQQPAPTSQQQPQTFQQPAYQQQVGPTPYSQAPVQMNAAPMNANQPMPVSYGGGAGVNSDNPSLPGYAWPGYAAHPNYGAVTYPKQYSPSAWPYIGPFYPYPQVPLGWRKVTLEWDDGWWFLDFHNK